MKKNLLFFLFATASFMIIGFTSSCNKAGELCFDFAQNTTVNTNAVATPGTVTVSKTVGSALYDQLTGKGVKIDQVNTVSVKAITITIPSTAGYTFDDISAAEVTVNSISLGKLPTNATGLTATFRTPTQSDFKSAFLTNTNSTMNFTATFKKAVNASTLNVQIPLNTCYQVL